MLGEWAHALAEDTMTRSRTARAHGEATRARRAGQAGQPRACRRPIRGPARMPAVRAFLTSGVSDRMDATCVACSHPAYVWISLVSPDGVALEEAKQSDRFALSWELRPAHPVVPPAGTTWATRCPRRCAHTSTRRTCHAKTSSSRLPTSRWYRDACRLYVDPERSPSSTRARDGQCHHDLVGRLYQDVVMCQQSLLPTPEAQQTVRAAREDDEDVIHAPRRRRVRVVLDDDGDSPQ